MKQFRYLSLAALLPSLSSHALEVDPGDYEPLPVGATIGVLYYQHSTTDNAYSQGHKTSSDFNLTSDVGILRLLHIYQLSERLTIEPQFLLPFGHVSGGGDASGLGDASGIGDLILTAPLKYRLNDANDTLPLYPSWRLRRYLSVRRRSVEKNNGAPRHRAHLGPYVGIDVPKGTHQFCRFPFRALGWKRQIPG